VRRLNEEDAGDEVRRETLIHEFVARHIDILGVEALEEEASCT
jgi:hypothetical protein